MTTFRLRPLIEVVEDADGAIYLLRGPGGGDCVIRRPPPDAMAVIEALRRGGTLGELGAHLQAHGTAVGDLRAMIDELAAAGLTEAVEPYDGDERYDRQLLYLRERAPHRGGASAMQERLGSAHVVVLGCGGLGSWAITGLACIGVGRITLVDDDRVELSNLNRQVLFREADIGRRKVEAAADALAAFNSSISVRPVARRIARVSDISALIEDADVVLGLADQPPYLIARWLNIACHRASVPHLSAGQLPPIVRVGPLVVPGASACTNCLELQLRQDNPLYDRLEALRRSRPTPSATLGPASGVVGSLLAMEVLHHVTRLVTPATLGAVWTVDLRDLSAERLAVAQREECDVCSG